MTENDKKKKEASLKASLISVLFIGGFILITWLGVLILYYYRN